MHLNPPPPPRAGFVRQRLVLSASFINGGFPMDDIPGSWVSDVTFPAAVVSSVMTVAGSGACVLAWNLEGATIGEVRVRRNGVEVVGAGGSGSGSVAVTVAAGDTLTAWAVTEWAGWVRLDAGSWIEVRPA